jgi:copper chaperone CopZ
MNVVKTLSSIQGLLGVDVSLESKKIKVIYRDKEISRDDIKEIVSRSILSGKVVKLKH